MNGQISEHPLAELIHELATKNLSGRLRLEFDKRKVAVYFQSGALIYAACNVRTLRFGEYLLKGNVLTADDLLHLGSRTTDFDLAQMMVSEKRVSAAHAKKLQTRQVSDVLRFALLWTEGSWEFDYRSKLSEEVELNVDVTNLLLETARRLPDKFISTRFRNSAEVFSPVGDPPNVSNLSPAELFLLSRVDAATPLSDIVAGSGLSEPETLRGIYAVALVGLIQREYWHSAFRDLQSDDIEETKPAPSVAAEQITPADNLESFLDRLSSASSHYEVLGVSTDTTMSELKNAYYDLARKYHPDRFRTGEKSRLGRVESAFARITQAYDTLRDAGLRATYDSKLEAQARAAKLAQEAPKATTPVRSSPTPTSTDETINGPRLSTAQHAEVQFKDGFAALELGQRNVAIGLLGSAARAVPHEPRYRAYYGRALALHESTRRLAEGELQAAVKLEPENSQYRMMLAELYRDLGFKVRAKAEAERAVAADRTNYKARDLLRSLS